MSVAYEDFSLWVEPGGTDQTFRVQARSPAGEAWDEIQLPGLSDTWAAQPLPPMAGTPRDLAVAAAARMPEQDARRRGDALFRAIFGGRVGRLFAASRAQPSDPPRGLRIKLHFDPTRPFAGAMSGLPWELLYDSETKDFLGINPLTPVVRYMEVPRGIGVTAFKAPLRVLLAASNPATTAPLDLQRERALIEEAWATDPEVTIRVLERSDGESLQDELGGGAFDVLHFMGHASFDEGSGTGAVMLDGPRGSPEPMPGEILADLLKGRLPRLVVLNACNSARSLSGAGLDFSSGLAAALVLAGVPAVVAMRTPVSDRAAIRFSKVLYRQVARGDAVDAAVAEGRRELYRCAPASPGWATPVLFMRVADGRLFAAPAQLPIVPPAVVPRAGRTILIKSKETELNNCVVANQIGQGGDSSGSDSIEMDSERLHANGTRIVNQDTGE